MDGAERTYMGRYVPGVRIDFDDRLTALGKALKIYEEDIIPVPLDQYLTTLFDWVIIHTYREWKE